MTCPASSMSLSLTAPIRLSWFPAYRRPPVARRLLRELEIDLGFAARDDIRKRPAGARAHGPAERAVAGVEIQPLEARGADERHVGGRGGTKPRPERRLVVVARVREHLARALRERLAAP